MKNSTLFFRKAVQIRHQKKQDKLKERLEEQTKKHQNEEIFQRWLINKSKKKGMSKKTAKTIDTLARSDVYIQMHASYASNHNVPYSIDCSLKRKLNNKIQITAEKKTIKKTIVLEKMSDKISAHFKL